MPKTEESAPQLNQTGVGFHRSYRKLHYGSLTGRLASHTLILVIIVGIVLFFLEHLSLLYSSLAAGLLNGSIADLHLHAIRILNIKVWLLNGQGRFPSHYLLALTALLSALAWILVILIKKIPLPIRLLIKLVAALNLFGCLFFWLWGSHFPYHLNDFSVLYVSSEVGMWIAIPVLLIFALMPVPISLFAKTLLVVFTNVFIYILGILRYALFLYILTRFSYLWMALLYFGFGVLLDFAYVITFYSYFVSVAAPSITNKRKIWRWLYSS